nr:glycerophosphodiester phosphodiesterase family protein [Isachenkonia alkalipeptolytica]
MVYAGRNVEVISHRGIVSGEFENSLSAVRGSLEAQVDAVGMDVQMTKDEVIVLNHDPTLKRTFGLPHNIRNTEYKELMEQEPILPRNFEAGDPYLPTLDEVLTLIDGQMTIHIDVKTFGESELYAEKIVKVVEENDMEEYAYIQSFDYDFLKKVKELNPEIKTAQILYFALGDIGSLEVDYLTVYKGMLSDELVQRTRRSEKGLFVWTVNTEESIQEVLQYDIDGIITDYPLRVQEIMGRRRD